MIVTRGYARKSSQRGGIIVSFGYGRFILGAILRMKVASREAANRVSALVEGREVGP